MVQILRPKQATMGGMSQGRGGQMFPSNIKISPRGERCCSNIASSGRILQDKLKWIQWDYTRDSISEAGVHKPCGWACRWREYFPIPRIVFEPEGDTVKCNHGRTPWYSVKRSRRSSRRTLFRVVYKSGLDRDDGRGGKHQNIPKDVEFQSHGKFWCTNVRSCMRSG
jgi:hypothetical protein